MSLNEFALILIMNASFNLKTALLITVNANSQIQIYEFSTLAEISSLTDIIFLNEKTKIYELNISILINLTQSL